jgi:ubiquinone/menaquinone biosynthesis C-methylase UbiE
MIKTNYQGIAKTYDDNKDRLDIPKDPIIGNLCSQEIRVLDLGCGTGNYLQMQQKYYPGSNIEWYGLDASPDMLKIAKAKNKATTFFESRAEQMDFAEGYFDYVVCNFAFHHFENKHLVLDLLYKCLKNRGIFKYKNIIPEMMKNWWVYKYCPETYYEDLNRFWEKDLFVYELEKRNFKTLVDIQYKEDYRDLEIILNDYKRRDTSQLSIIDDKYYEQGLEYLNIQKANGVKAVRNYFGLIEILGEKII